MDPSPAPMFRVLRHQVAHMMSRASPGSRHHDEIFDDAVARFEGPGRGRAGSHETGSSASTTTSPSSASAWNRSSTSSQEVEFETDDGVLVDEHSRAAPVTSSRSATSPDRCRPVFKHQLRVEHSQNADAVGCRSCTRHARDSTAPYNDVHWFSYGPSTNANLRVRGLPRQ